MTILVRNNSGNVADYNFIVTSGGPQYDGSGGAYYGYSVNNYGSISPSPIFNTYNSSYYLGAFITNGRFPHELFTLFYYTYPFVGGNFPFAGIYITTPDGLTYYGNYASRYSIDTRAEGGFSPYNYAYRCWVQTSPSSPSFNFGSWAVGSKFVVRLVAAM